MNIRLQYKLLIATLFMFVVGTIFWLYPSQQMEAESVSNALESKSEATERAMILFDKDSNIEIRDIRLVQYKDFDALTGTGTNYEMDRHGPDSPVWAVAVNSPQGWFKQSEKETVVIFFLSAGTGEVLGLQEVEKDNKDVDLLEALLKIPDLDGQIEITPIEIELPIDIEPTEVPLGRQ